MTITETEAARALADINDTELRGRDARIYRGTSAIIILWGVIWMAAYAASGLWPADGSLIWLPADGIGIAGSIYLGRRYGQGQRSARPYAIIGIATFVFIGALFAIDPPRSVASFEAVPPLLVGFLYIVFGASRLTRFVAIGAVLIAATLIGYFAFQPMFAFWMAAVGGVCLVVSGLWLRRS